MKLEKYTIGTGDRFGKQGKAQLKAIQEAVVDGIAVVPVWNKSFREHTTIGTSPIDTSEAAGAAVEKSGWGGPWHVDADHIGRDTVDSFLDVSDFFTLDVADFTGQTAAQEDMDAFVNECESFVGQLQVEGLDEPVHVTRDDVQAVASKYLLAVQEAGKLYRYIRDNKDDAFITEVSMDETDAPQTPLEMLFILFAIAREKIPAQTIAPKFTGAFNKGVDYVGDLAQFEQEFNSDLAVIQYAVKHFDLPDNLKLSVHSGSDKFSIYPVMNRALKRFQAGIHLKTAGTTWLEELIGLAEAGGHGLDMAKTIYAKAMERFDELCAPYAPVIDIDPLQLPLPEAVRDWRGMDFVEALRHDQGCSSYNLHFRQLLHVAYKIAAEMGNDYLKALDKNEATVAENVRYNLLERHIKPLLG
jgi:hypothetical protein